MGILGRGLNLDAGFFPETFVVGPQPTEKQLIGLSGHGPLPCEEKNLAVGFLL